MSRNAQPKNKSPLRLTRQTLQHLWRLGVALLWFALAPGNGAGADGTPARVFLVEDRGAMQVFEPQQAVVAGMVQKALVQLTGQTNVVFAWRSLVSTNDVVGIKVFTAPGAVCGTRAAVVAVVIEGLLAAGLPPANIIVWDKRAQDMYNAGFSSLTERYGVQLKGALESGYDETVYYENPILGTLVWGDLEFGKGGEVLGRNSYVSKLLTKQITKIITVSPLLNNNLTGVTGHLYSLALGSVDNTGRFEVSGDRLAVAVPEIYALPVLSDRVVLNITDALICQYEGGQRGLLHYSTVLSQLWFSRDPVALDVLAVHEIERQRRRAGAPPRKVDLALYHNAALLELGECNTNRIEVTHLQ